MKGAARNHFCKYDMHQTNPLSACCKMRDFPDFHSQKISPKKAFFDNEQQQSEVYKQRITNASL
jgi:hypothetical protein